MKSHRPRRPRFTRKKIKNNVFILKKYSPLGMYLDIAVSTNKQTILKKAEELLKKLPDEMWKIHRAMPFHQARSDEELRQFLKENPDSTHYCIIIYDNNTGEVVDSVIVTGKTTLSKY